MSYAIRNDGQGWRSVSSPADVAENETYSETSPKLVFEQNCKQLRTAEYPPLADYLDAIVKGDENQRQEYIDACLAVKAKYPK